MTLIYDTYYPNISSGLIDLANVNFGVILTNDSYQPKESDTIEEVIGIIEVNTEPIQGDMISTMTMSQIIDSIGQVFEKAIEARYFVVVDINTGDLCFCEELQNLNYGQ